MIMLDGDETKEEESSKKTSEYKAIPDMQVDENS
jgi:hypothetical protein